MRQFILAPILLLAACASPAPEFIGARHYETEQGGIRFTVFHKGNEAEVIRHGYLTKHERAAVPALMVRAAELTTGCRVVPDSLRSRIPGDTGEARLALRC